MILERLPIVPRTVLLRLYDQLWIADRALDEAGYDWLLDVGDVIQLAPARLGGDSAFYELASRAVRLVGEDGPRGEDAGGWWLLRIASDPLPGWPVLKTEPERGGEHGDCKR